MPAASGAQPQGGLPRAYERARTRLIMFTSGAAMFFILLVSGSMPLGCTATRVTKRCVCLLPL